MPKLISFDFFGKEMSRKTFLISFFYRFLVNFIVESAECQVLKKSLRRFENDYVTSSERDFIKLSPPVIYYLR